MDLRKSLASAILVVGGTPMLPGFLPRLHAEILRALAPPSTPDPVPHGRPRPSGYDRYAALRQLTPYIAILNNPAPPPPASLRAGENAGKAPAFTPATMAWVGGSLAGCVAWVILLSHRIVELCLYSCSALKTGGVEVAREKWDEADSQIDPDEEMVFAPQTPSGQSILPDWTRSPLPVGAPPARAPQTGLESVLATPVATVGA